MYYFLAMCALLAVIGLAAISAAQDFGFELFGYLLFAFAILFGSFLLKRHFDHADGSARH
jgi:hypothetical protein